uniref:NADH dehydrogenase subunit 6 n=1 Tax=Haplobothrium globuliforme TaxID=108250 RepID=A0A8F7CD96_9CEST|nr:NADH dehydrogenase subunit 6 [Haplobothrium globuliforme]
MLVNLSFFLYFVSLLLFSLTSNSIYYCVLLVLNSLLCCFVCYSIFGFSWYALLFCLVYVGGVYILFVFVSVHNPNSSTVSYSNVGAVSMLGILGLCAIVGFGFFEGLVVYECSSFLCSASEGWFYVCLCLTLLFGFFILSVVMSVKSNYYR